MNRKAAKHTSRKDNAVKFLKQWGPLLLAVAFALTLVGVAAHHPMSRAPELEEKMFTVWLPVIILLGTIAHAVGGLVQRYTGLSEIIGWLGVGMGLTNIPGLKRLTHQLMSDPRYNLEQVIEVAAQLGVWILLTEAGLETNLKTLRKNAVRGTGIAGIGVVVVGCEVYFALPYIFPEIDPVARVLVAAIVTATSMGVMKLFLDGKGITKSATGQLSLAVAGIDDVMALLILAAINGMMAGTGVDPLVLGEILFKAITFFILSLVSGAILAPHISHFMSRMNGGEAMRLQFALASSIVFGWIAHGWGLSPLMGAYCGGIFLTEVHFRNFEGGKEEHGVEDLLKGVRYVVVPIFVISVAMKVNIALLFKSTSVALLAVNLSGLIVGKVLAGLLAGPGNDKLTVMSSTVPRGEVALLLAKMGFAAGLIGPDIMSVTVMTMGGSILITSATIGYAVSRALARDPHIFDAANDNAAPHEERHAA